MASIDKCLKFIRKSGLLPGKTTIYTKCGALITLTNYLSNPCESCGKNKNIDEEYVIDISTIETAIEIEKELVKQGFNVSISLHSDGIMDYMGLDFWLEVYPGTGIYLSEYGATAALDGLDLKENFDEHCTVLEILRGIEEKYGIPEWS